ncbi:MAG: hypothetical protein B6D74_06430 [gamma proteobacterium symbiont of Ctena orbiculata]|nr:MAG: hypothetical protein DBP00_06615 [gamma proteobacterium symbiont of Ctena orbiculata]PVV11344.1 MAG: hypothetical protein B6D82_11475 [gamma proteobacterium symbiont of Ctena orbiculata]PVV24012.1 MAG: hypothetical protein B6D74_06430 [gamma proteobacterium symbiont of Ctena orbiculata]
MHINQKSNRFSLFIYYTVATEQLPDRMTTSHSAHAFTIEREIEGQIQDASNFNHQGGRACDLTRVVESSILFWQSQSYFILLSTIIKSVWSGAVQLAAVRLLRLLQKQCEKSDYVALGKSPTGKAENRHSFRNRT